MRRLFGERTVPGMAPLPGRIPAGALPVDQAMAAVG
jgi:hypothetical protein